MDYVVAAGKPLRVSPLTNRSSPIQSMSPGPSPLQTYHKRPSTTAYTQKNSSLISGSKSSSFDKVQDELKQNDFGITGTHRSYAQALQLSRMPSSSGHLNSINMSGVANRSLDGDLSVLSGTRTMFSGNIKKKF